MSPFLLAPASAAQIWTQRPPVTSKEYYEYPLKIAAADLIRARKRVTGEKATALSLGAVRGRTVELAEAEAVAEVRHIGCLGP